MVAEDQFQPYFVVSKKLLQETPFVWQNLMRLVNLTFIELDEKSQVSDMPELKEIKIMH